MTSSVSELIERVRGATGPDRELDRDLCIAFAMDMSEEDGSAGWRKAPNFTASLDAALALVERCLPGWQLEMLRTNYCAVEMWKPDDQGFFNSGRDPIVRRVEGATLPLAILLALLLSLQSQEPTP